MKIAIFLLSVVVINVLLLIKLKKWVKRGGSFYIAEPEFPDYEFSLPSHPIPFGEGEEVVLWTGNMEIELSCQEEEIEQHYKIKLTRVAVRETRILFLEGVDLETGEDVSFRRLFMKAKIKPAKKGWMEDSEFLASLDIDVNQYDFWWLYKDAKQRWEEEQQEASFLTLWSSEQPVDIEFTYQPDVDLEWYTVELCSIQQDAADGQIYFTGTCKTTGEARTFNASNAVSKITYAGKKYSIEEFIAEKLRAESSAA